MKGDPRRATDERRALAGLMPCFACGTAAIGFVEVCQRSGCGPRAALERHRAEAKSRREVMDALEHGRLWGCSKGDRVETRWGTGVVAAVVIEHAMARRIEVRMDTPGDGDQVRHVFRAGDIRRAEG